MKKKITNFCIIVFKLNFFNNNKIHESNFFLISYIYRRLLTEIEMRGRGIYYVLNRLLYIVRIQILKFFFF